MKTILVVDDDADALETAHMILTCHGYKSIACSDISTALTLLASRETLDLVIIDLHMPEMNGLELHARIKELRPGLPCIMTTGDMSVESFLNAINSGVFEYFNKPYKSTKLLAVVAAALKESTMISRQADQRS